MPRDEERPVKNRGGRSTFTPPAAPDGRVRANDVRAIERLYDTHGGRAYALALRILGTQAMAEDAVQEGFLAIWKGRHSFDLARGTEGAWVFAVVRNRALDRLRAESRHAAYRDLSAREANSLPADEDTEAAALVNIKVADVQRALGILPAPQRSALELAFFGGLTQAEIAARLRVPLGTIKGRLRLGLRRLRVLLRAPADATPRPHSQ